MKNSLFEMLMNFFEQNLSKMAGNDSNAQLLLEDENAPDKEDAFLHIKSAAEDSIRIFTYEEQMKFTKAAYQFLMRLRQWDIITTGCLEQIICGLVFSESHIVTLEETKWTIRNFLANDLDAVQLAFLDLVLYQDKDNMTLQ